MQCDPPGSFNNPIPYSDAAFIAAFKRVDHRSATIKEFCGYCQRWVVNPCTSPEQARKCKGK